MSTLLTVRNSLKYSTTCLKTPFMAPFLNDNPMTRARTSTATAQSPTLSPPSNEWHIIYRLPLIRVASAFNRVKIPYGMVNAVAIPGAFALEQASQLPEQVATLISAVGITTWLTLSICSLVTKNLVGIMYVNGTNDKLKLAYIDYWGKRCDAIIDVDDLVPESEKRKPSTFDFYQSLSLYSNEKVKYKLLQRFGSIEDPGTFASIFGE